MGSKLGAFDGAVQLAQRLATSDEVRTCVATQWFRYGFGRTETSEDACTLAALGSAFTSSGFKMKDLLVALTQSDAFLYRKVVRPEGGSL